MEVDKNSIESIAFLAGLKEDTTLITQAGFFANQPAIYAGIISAVGLGMTPTAATTAVLAGADGQAFIANPAGGNTQVSDALSAKGFTTAAIAAAYSAVTASEVSKGLFTGQKREQSATLNMKVEDDKLTVKIVAELDSSKQFDLKQAAFSFDYGVGAVTFDVAGTQNRWNADIFYVDDYNKDMSSLDFTFIPAPQMGNVFFTLISNKAVGSKVRYENNDDRILPIMQLGYEYTSAMLDAKVGGVFDKYKGETASNDYTGYLGFGNVTVKLGNIKELENGSMAFGLSGVYGQNVSAFAAMDPADMESATISLSQIALAKNPGTDPILVAKIGNDDTKVWGGLVFFAGSFWTGGLVYTDFRYSQLKFGSEDPFSAYKFQVSVTQYLSKNFYVMPGAGYETYSVSPDDKPYDKAWGYEATIEAGYKF